MNELKVERKKVRVKRVNTNTNTDLEQNDSHVGKIYNAILSYTGFELGIVLAESSEEIVFATSKGELLSLSPRIVRLQTPYKFPDGLRDVLFKLYRTYKRNAEIQAQINDLQTQMNEFQGKLNQGNTEFQLLLRDLTVAKFDKKLSVEEATAVIRANIYPYVLEVLLANNITWRVDKQKNAVILECQNLVWSQIPSSCSFIHVNSDGSVSIDTDNEEYSQLLQKCSVNDSLDLSLPLVSEKIYVSDDCAVKYYARFEYQVPIMWQDYTQASCIKIGHAIM